MGTAKNRPMIGHISETAKDRRY